MVDFQQPEVDTHILKLPVRPYFWSDLYKFKSHKCPRARGFWECAWKLAATLCPRGTVYERRTRLFFGDGGSTSKYKIRFFQVYKISYISKAFLVFQKSSNFKLFEIGGITFSSNDVMTSLLLIGQNLLVGMIIKGDHFEMIKFNWANSPLKLTERSFIWRFLSLTSWWSATKTLANTIKKPCVEMDQVCR